MKRIPILTTAFVLAGVVATVEAAPPEVADTLTAAAPDGDESEDADDILLVIDLPLVAEELREEGVDEAEVDDALAAAEEAEAPAGDAADMLDGEAEAIKSRGVKKNFNAWARRHLAKGHKGVVLRQLALERAEAADLTDEEKAELKEAFKKTKAANKERKEAIKAKREAIKKSGKAQKLRGKAKHEKWRKHATKKHLETLEKLKADGVDDPRIDKAIKKAKKQLKEARKDHKDAREDAKDAREDAKDAREDAKGEREEAKDAREDAKDAREDAKDARKKALEGLSDEEKKALKQAMKEANKGKGGKGKGKGGKKGGGR